MTVTTTNVFTQATRLAYLLTDKVYPHGEDTVAYATTANDIIVDLLVAGFTITPPPTAGEDYAQILADAGLDPIRDSLLAIKHLRQNTHAGGLIQCKQIVDEIVIAHMAAHIRAADLDTGNAKRVRTALVDQFHVATSDKRIPQAIAHARIQNSEPRP